MGYSLILVGRALRVILFSETATDTTLCDTYMWYLYCTCSHRNSSGCLPSDLIGAFVHGRTILVVPLVRARGSPVRPTPA